MSVVWANRKDFDQAIKSLILPTPVCLDIGCGIHPQDFQVHDVHICAEPFGEYVNFLQDKLNRRQKNSNKVLIRADWQNIIKLMPPLSVDTVYLIDVIEHLDKDLGKKLLRNTLKLARKQIVIFTPLGFIPQDHGHGKDAWGLGGHNQQKHRSGWEPKDFDKSWQIIAVKDFHVADNMGQTFHEPQGAFLAVKNIDSDQDLLKLWQKNLAEDLTGLKIKIKRKINRLLSLIRK